MLLRNVFAGLAISAMAYSITFAAAGTWTGSTDTAGNAYRYGNVGIGIASPLALLHTQTATGTENDLRITQNARGDFAFRIPAYDLVLTNKRLSTDVLFVSGGGATSGNIGIGTVSPATKLDVAGTISINDSVNKVISLIPNVSVNGNQRTLRFSNSTIVTNEGFQFWNANSSTNLMMIQQNGLVGVGTTSPGQKLDVQGASGADAFIRVAGGTGSTKGGVYLGNGAGNYGCLKFDNSNNNLYLLQQYGSGNLCLGANSSTAMNISSSGGVSIGATYVDPGSGNLIATGGGAGTAGKVCFYNVNSGNYDYITCGSYGVLQFFTGLSTGSLTNTASLSPYGDFSSTGSITAGTNLAAATLSTTGDVTVGGKIVMGHGWTIQTPDYVFSPTYKLPKIDETARFIKENRHLPDVPSTAEVKKNGIDLAQMNMALLKNLETVTLYVIEQKKSIDEQAIELDKQRQEIEQLKLAIAKR